MYKRDGNGTNLLTQYLKAASQKSSKFAREWQPSGQFSGQSSYKIEQVKATMSDTVPSSLSEGRGQIITFNIPPNAIYDMVNMVFSFGAFTAADPGDTISWDVPIERITARQGGSPLFEVLYTDYTTAFKLMTTDGKKSWRDRGMFADENDGDYPAFQMVVPVFGFKNYGYSEDASRDYTILPILSKTHPIELEVTLRSMFDIAPNTATVPPEPSLLSMRIWASKRVYDDPEDEKRDFAILQGRTANHIITTYDSSYVTSKSFTTDASGTYPNLTLDMSAIETVHVNWLLLRLRPQNADRNSESATVFGFSGESSRIQKFGHVYRQIGPSYLLKPFFSLQHKGRTFDSDYDGKNVDDGELLILSSPSSIFELQDISPNYYEPASSPTLELYDIYGLSPNTTYYLDIYVSRMLPLRVDKQGT